MLQSTVNGFGMERPMVGIHIRRTDKVNKSMVELKPSNICHSQVGTEAAFHPVEEYMKYVEEWFRLVLDYLSRLWLAHITDHCFFKDWHLQWGNGFNRLLGNGWSDLIIFSDPRKISIPMKC